MIDLNKQKLALADLTDLNWLKQRFFVYPDQRIKVKTGEVIIRQGEVNEKMYFMESGSTSGYFKPEEGEEFKVFSTGTNMMVGLYSFFSHDHRSYTTVKADEDTVVLYVSRDQLPEKNSPEYGLFLEHILPVIVNEIYLRQMLMINSVSEKESVLKKLMESEKMATLGQLAAGLAHELNNAASVIQSKVEWITEHMKDYMEQKDSKGLYPYFLRSLEKGQTKSSTEVRARKEKIKELIGVQENAAKKLAKMNLTDEELMMINQKNDSGIIDRLGNYWEAGLALHDINIAASHTTHVVQSIKELGAANRREHQNFSLLSSIEKAHSLLTNQLKHIETSIDVHEDIKINGKEGDFIQVWVNLIKNAAEVLNTKQPQSPQIIIEASKKGSLLHVIIKDNGGGIEESEQSKIFQPSYTTKVSGLSFGLGLGLSIVQKILSSYEGQIQLTCQDEWTIFNIQLPKQ